MNPHFTSVITPTVAGNRITSREITKHSDEFVDKVLAEKMASNAFILNALSSSTDTLISLMNSWNGETMKTFINSYNESPEPILGKLFSRGLDTHHLPEDIVLSQPFLRVAANENPKKLVDEVLNKYDVERVRHALTESSPTDIKRLSDNGLSSDAILAESPRNYSCLA
jgi:hypothetical protein